jgi:hypothetical protein
VLSFLFTFSDYYHEVVEKKTPVPASHPVFQWWSNPNHYKINVTLSVNLLIAIENVILKDFQLKPSLFIGHESLTSCVSNAVSHLENVTNCVPTAVSHLENVTNCVPTAVSHMEALPSSVPTAVSHMEALTSSVPTAVSHMEDLTSGIPNAVSHMEVLTNCVPTTVSHMEEIIRKTHVQGKYTQHSLILTRLVIKQPSTIMSRKPLLIVL